MDRSAAKLLVIPIVAMACALALGKGPRFVSGIQSTSQSEIRTLTENFFAAIQHKDIEAVSAFWSNDSKEKREATEKLSVLFGSVREVQVKSVALTKLTLEGEQATACVSTQIDAMDAKTDKPSSGFGGGKYVLYLVKRNGAWKISRYLPAEQDLAERVSQAKTKDERNVLLSGAKEILGERFDFALNQVAISAAKEGRNDYALDLFDLLAQVATQSGDKHSAGLAARNAALLCSMEGKLNQALEYSRKALAIGKEGSFQSLVADELEQIGLLLSKMGDHASAHEYLTEAIATADATGNKSLKSLALLNLAENYCDENNLRDALKYAGQGLALAQEVHNDTQIAAELQLIGSIHFAQGNIAQSREYNLKALEIAQGADNRWGIAGSLTSLGNCESAVGNYGKALDYYQRSLKIAEQMNYREMIGDAWGNIGVVQLWQKDFSSSLDSYHKALALYEEIGSKPKICDLWHNIGDLYTVMGDYARAREAAETSLAMARKLGVPDLLAAALTTAGGAYRGLHDLSKAQSAFVEAIGVMEQMRAQEAGGGQEGQSYLQTGQGPAYAALIGLLTDQHKYSEALEYAERVKARVLLDVLRSGKVNITGAMSAGEVEQERKITAALASVNSQIVKERTRDHPDADRLSGLAAQLASARFDRDSFETGLYAAHPDLKAQRGEFSPVSLAACGALIPDSQTALLEYVQSKDTTYLFILTRETVSPALPDVRVYKIEVQTAELTSMVKRFRDQIASRDIRFDQTALRLYDLLLKPAAEQLSGKTNLVLVPDGPLWDLPFQALQSSPNHFVVSDAAISYVPSLTALVEMSKRRAGRTGGGFPIELLALGDPAIGSQTNAQVKDVLMDADLRDLPQAERQVKDLAKLYGGKASAVYVGASATEDRLKQDAPKCRILHLAAHGVLDDNNPMYSQIILSRDAAGAEDGVLETWEILNLDLKADLVVLAGCETARGRIETGEGIIGLSWAFFVAGSASTVVSQWNVDAQGTSELMLRFHRNLRAGMSKSEALRRAELDLLKKPRYADPFFWAPFVLIGTTDPVY